MSQAGYNKRIASVKFEIKQGAFSKNYSIRLYPVDNGDSFYIDGNKGRIEAIAKFLNAMPLIELAGYLSARDARYKNWLETGNFAYPETANNRSNHHDESNKR